MRLDEYLKALETKNDAQLPRHSIKSGFPILLSEDAQNSLSLLTKLNFLSKEKEGIFRHNTWGVSVSLHPKISPNVLTTGQEKYQMENFKSYLTLGPGDNPHLSTYRAIANCLTELCRYFQDKAFPFCLPHSGFEDDSPKNRAIYSGVSPEARMP